MLVLTRRVNEEIHIFVPPSEEVRLVRVVMLERQRSRAGDRARLGVDADPDVRIIRSELSEVGDVQ